MRDQTQRLPAREQQRLTGDLRPLAEELGSPAALERLGSDAAGLRLQKVRSAADLRQFLSDYRSEILLPLELPTINRAFEHARRSEARELIEMDQALSREPLLREFATASQLIGRGQLKLLKPLRDQRVIQRYLQAIDDGKAHGWHTIVYGLALAVFSLPLRQGLISYGHQTLNGFVYSASCPVLLPDNVRAEILAEATSGIAVAANALLSAGVV